MNRRTYERRKLRVVDVQVFQNSGLERAALIEF